MKKIVLVCSSVFAAIASLMPTAQAITPGQMGAFLAREMCADYIATGEFINPDGYEDVAVKLIAEYGADSALVLLDIAPRLSQSPEDLVNDPYLFPMLQSAITHMAKNDACLKKILSDEIFTEVEFTDPGSPQPADNTELNGQ